MCFAQQRRPVLGRPLNGRIAENFNPRERMREEIRNLVDPVLTYGLELKERLLRRESPDPARERARLLGMLNAPEGGRHAEFVGDSSTVLGNPARAADPGRASDRFLGIRYALACWLDEIFIDSPWGNVWENQSIEFELFRQRDRAWNFWQQARRAEGRQGSDALEVFYLCVMLGFRGDFREQPEELRTWVATARVRLSRGQGNEWPAPPQLDPVTNVPPRWGRQRLRRMTLVAAVVMLALIPCAILAAKMI